MEDKNMRGEILLIATQNCVSPSNDFIFYIGLDNHLLTNTSSTCMRANLHIYDNN